MGAFQPVCVCVYVCRCLCDSACGTNCEEGQVSPGLAQRTIPPGLIPPRAAVAKSPLALQVDKQRSSEPRKCHIVSRQMTLPAAQKPFEFFARCLAFRR